MLIGLGLAMDAFAVSVSSGISIPGLRLFYMIRAALCFGVFQFFMPIVGWLLGKTLVEYIAAYDHWVAFGILGFLGGKMLKDVFFAPHTETEGEAEVSPKTDIRGMGTLLTLAVATSIDALAVGISFSVLSRDILRPAALIGLITAGVCLAGFEFGRRIGGACKRRAQMLGGFILIGIGCKILIEHLWLAPSGG
jgi:putative Mn2+ efflux pump MntP